MNPMTVRHDTNAHPICSPRRREHSTSRAGVCDSASSKRHLHAQKHGKRRAHHVLDATVELAAGISGSHGVDSTHVAELRSEVVRLHTPIATHCRTSRLANRQPMGRLAPTGRPAHSQLLLSTCLNFSVDPLDLIDVTHVSSDVKSNPRRAPALSMLCMIAAFTSDAGDMGRVWCVAPSIMNGWRRRLADAIVDASRAL